MSTQKRRVGFRFRPKIDFLIKLLQFKAAGGGDISGCTEFPDDLYFLDLYGPEKEPWKVFSGEHEIWELHDVNKSTTKEKYVLTRLTKMGVKNATRLAGKGSWDDQSKAKYVDNNLGYWRTLTYEYWGGDGAEADKDYYYMNELHLTEQGLREVGAETTDFVICRVIKNELKRCRIKHGNKRGISQYDACYVPKKKAKMTKKNKGAHVQEEECRSEFQASTSGKIEIDDDVPPQECYFDQPVDYNATNLRESMSDIYGILEQDERDFVQQGNFSALLLDDHPQMQENLDQCCNYPDISGFVYQQQEGYVSNLSGLEQYQQQQQEAYVLDCSGLEQQNQEQEVYVDDDDFVSRFEQYQQQEVYVGECSELEENKEEEELGILHCLMDSPVRQVDLEQQINNQLSLENLENFFMGGSC